MRSLAADDLLDVWDHGQGLASTERALLLLAAALAPATPGEIAGWSLGRRDGLLLTLREQLFGSQMRSVTACPTCGERLDLDFATTDIRAGNAAISGPLFLAMGGYEVVFRLPDSHDLCAVRQEGANQKEADTQALAFRLLHRCILEAVRGAEPVHSGDLPEAVVAEINRRMAEAEPQADVQIALVCPACGHAWGALLEIGAFLWAEIDAWAVRALHEVHLLASAYGWREADILALSPRRRQHYLALVTA